MFNKSPMLWFYFQRKDADLKRKTEQELCAEFLETRFWKNSFLIKNYFLNADGRYELSSKPIRFPTEDNFNDTVASRILQAFTPGSRMKDVCEKLGLELDFYELNNARIKLTTSGYPYLLARG
jgi:hypothetical protein